MIKENVTMENAFFETIAFNEIEVGDIIAHYVENHNGEDLLWYGKVLNTFQGIDWWGTGRYHTSRKSDPSYINVSPWEPLSFDNREDVLIVSEWHNTEPGHKIYRMS